jgi:hypothetical protein
MHDDKAKKIGSATYLNKTDEQYIPFLVFMGGSDCRLIQSMLSRSSQTISYVKKDNSL